MTTDVKTVAIVPLKGSKYPTWRVQCRMALMRDGLWGIVSGTKEAPSGEASADSRSKFQARKDRALSTVVLTIDPTLLYLIGNEPDDPWKSGKSFRINSRKRPGLTN